MPIELGKAYVCAKCDHAWMPNYQDWTELPAKCPKCKSPAWNGAKRDKAKEREIQERRDVISEEW